MIRLPGARLVTLLVFGVAVLFFVLTLDLGRVARLVPMMVAIPTLVCVLLQAAVDFLPGLSYRPTAPGQRDQTPADEPNAHTPWINGNVFRMLGWLVSFPALVMLAGFSPAIPAFMFLYLKAHNESLCFSLAMAAGAWGFFQLFFVLMLNLSFYEGILF